MELWRKSVRLEGKSVILEPLSMEHLEGMKEAVLDGKLWELWYTVVPTPEKAEDYIKQALDMQEREGAFPFVIISKKDNRVVGSTRYFDCRPEFRRLEIGWTWLAKSAQGTAINTESKILMLSYAFEKLKTISVVFSTHVLNFQSRKAIEKLGAKQDGILRNHMIMPNGTIRDTVFYSITMTEWPAVKSMLSYKLNSYL